MVRTWDGPKFTVMQRRELKRAAWNMHAVKKMRQTDIAKELGVAPSTIHYWICEIRDGRSDYQAPTVFETIASRIRAELVCCDIYDRIKAADAAEAAELRRGHDYHSICFWGEAAAQIALQEGRR